MEICCYIIYSQNIEKFYIGACQNNLVERVKKHNTGYYGKGCFTAQATDWELYLRIDTESYSHAIRIERKIKSMKSSKYIKNLKNYPELCHKIWLETKST